MDVLLYNVITAVLLILFVQAGKRLAIRRNFPVVAVVLTALVLAGLLLQAVWPGAMDALDSDPSRSGWWRPLTSVFMQNGGPIGDAYNVITIALVAALAEWHWGRLKAAALFVAGAIGPYAIGMIFGGSQVSTEPRNWAGSSGATYFLGATLAGALLIRSLRTRDAKGVLLAASAPVVGLATWFAQDNAHGLVVAYGAALGLVVAVLTPRGHEKGDAAEAASPVEDQERCVSRS